MKQLIHVSLQEYLDNSIKARKKLYDLRRDFDPKTEEGKNLFNVLFYGLHATEPGLEEQIISSHMINLAKRAIEINDKQILDILIALGVIEEVKEKELNND